jgi:hypothetical protein
VLAATGWPQEEPLEPTPPKTALGAPTDAPADAPADASPAALPDAEPDADAS